MEGGPDRAAGLPSQSRFPGGLLWPLMSALLIGDMKRKAHRTHTLPSLPLSRWRRRRSG